MKSNNTNTGAVPAANRANTQSSISPRTEQRKSNTCSRPLDQGISAKRAAPKESRSKAEANRKNSLKSTGPTTPRGKSYSRSNSLKHGFYSKELLVSEADKPEFEEMRAGLEAVLEPGTTCQWLDFDYVVVCYWRRKLAVRLEHRQFARQLQDEQRDDAGDEAPGVDAVIERWYGSSRADIRLGIRSLEYAMAEFEVHGSFQEETKKFLMSGFGPDFVPLLEHWNTMSKDAILLADHIDSRRKDFGDIPGMDVKSSSPPGETTKVVIDPMQGRHMVGKLLEEHIHFLKGLLAITDRNTLAGKRDAGQSSDFNPRFLAYANREACRALDRYWSLKENNCSSSSRTSFSNFSPGTKFAGQVSTTCQSPAMRNGRCRMHGGASTGPRTEQGLEDSRLARWKHGQYSVQAKAQRKRDRQVLRHLRDLMKQP